jgi:hypothetical protein
LVYFREGGQGVLGLFTAMPEEIEELGVSLDDEVLARSEKEDEGALFILGNVDNLWGRTLAVRFKLSGQERVFSWTLVEE